MSLMTAEGYLESLQKLHVQLYAMGERVEDVTSHPFNAAACQRRGHDLCSGPRSHDGRPSDRDLPSHGQ